MLNYNIERTIAFEKGFKKELCSEATFSVSAFGGLLHNNIQLAWIPGRTGIEGNEIAECVPKEMAATTPIVSAPFMGVSPNNINKELRKNRNTMRGLKWHSSTGMR